MMLMGTSQLAGPGATDLVDPLIYSAY